MSNTRNSTNDGDLLPFAHLTEDEIFKKLLDEWCAPMDMEQLQSPILVENIDTDFTFGFENVKPGPSSLDVTANAGLQNQNQNLPAEATRLQAPETTDLKEIDDLKERYVDRLFLFPIPPIFFIHGGSGDCQANILIMI